MSIDQTFFFGTDIKHGPHHDPILDLTIASLALINDQAI